MGVGDFVFHPGFGKDVISGFDVTRDGLWFNHDLFPARAEASQIIDRTVGIRGHGSIIVDASNRLTLMGVTTADLRAHLDDFHFL
jgi:hypothetical protein